MVLELASDAELCELCDILYGRRSVRLPYYFIAEPSECTCLFSYWFRALWGVICIYPAGFYNFLCF
jgi:hypothetical protein